MENYALDYLVDVHDIIKELILQSLTPLAECAADMANLIEENEEHLPSGSSDMLKKYQSIRESSSDAAKELMTRLQDATAKMADAAEKRSHEVNDAMSSLDEIMQGMGSLAERAQATSNNK